MRLAALAIAICTLCIGLTVQARELTQAERMAIEARGDALVATLTAANGDPFATQFAPPGFTRDVMQEALLDAGLAFDETRMDEALAAAQAAPRPVSVEIVWAEQRLRTGARGEPFVLVPVDMKAPFGGKAVTTRQTLLFFRPDPEDPWLIVNVSGRASRRVLERDFPSFSPIDPFADQLQGR